MIHQINPASSNWSSKEAAIQPEMKFITIHFISGLHSCFYLRRLLQRLNDLRISWNELNWMSSVWIQTSAIQTKQINSILMQQLKFNVAQWWLGLVDCCCSLIWFNLLIEDIQSNQLNKQTNNQQQPAINALIAESTNCGIHYHPFRNLVSFRQSIQDKKHYNQVKL